MRSCSLPLLASRTRLFRPSTKRRCVVTAPHAHEYVWVLAVTDSSLASRVCNKDPSLSVASGQTFLVEQIEQYLTSFWIVPQDDILCCVACLIWFQLIMVELRKAVDFVVGVVVLWIKCRGVRSSRLDIGEDKVAFQEFSMSRLVLECVLSTVRISIALNLGVTACCGFFAPLPSRR